MSADVEPIVMYKIGNQFVVAHLAIMEMPELLAFLVSYY